MYDNGIRHYNSHNFSLTKITSGGFSSVYAANWNNTTKFAIKHFNETSKEDDIINEIKIIKLASPSIYNSILWSYETKRVNAATLIKLEIQLRFAKEIAWAILWLHDNDIIHGDLCKNIYIIMLYAPLVLGVVFWELTSCKSPFGEEPISGTIIEFVTLYRRCWRHEPQKRPDINEIMSELKNIDHIDSKNSNESKSSWSL
ncbi:unnamed protein product [Rhizophagus irregularis]|nr:unnamed protein product [Rhizophagus irregularis]